MTTLSLNEAMEGREKAVIIDLQTMRDNRYVKVYETYGDKGAALADAERKVDELPGVDDGRYGIDVSIFCPHCHTWHSEEADCAA